MNVPCRIVIAYGYRMIYQGNRRLIRSTYYDPLTGAYNRTSIRYIYYPVIRRTYDYSLAAMNVRQFKFINEIFGTREGGPAALPYQKDHLRKRQRR